MSRELDGLRTRVLQELSAGQIGLWGEVTHQFSVAFWTAQICEAALADPYCERGWEQPEPTAEPGPAMPAPKPGNGGSPMRIVRLTVSNIKRLKAVEIIPKGNIIELRGMNAAGKSSVIDAIAMLVGGKKLCPDKPIREGQARGFAEADLGELKVRRTFTLKDSWLTVTTADGVKQKSPQKILDDLADEIAFDPRDFARLDKAKRRDMLMSLLGVSDQLSDIDAEHERVFAKRTECNREAGRLAQVIDSAEVPDDTPDEPVDVEALQREHEAKTVEGNRLRLRFDALRTMDRDLAAVKRGRDLCEAEIQQLMETRHELAAEQDALFQRADLERKALADTAIPDPSAIVARIAAATTVNTNVAKKCEVAKLRQEHGHVAEQAEAHTGTLNRLNRDKAAILADAQYPIPGLGFDGEDVTFKGLPFSQASQSEQSTISVAMGMAMNPRLRILLMRDGSLLDDNTLQATYERVKAKGYQLWIERVGEDGAGEASVVIEDGNVKPTIRGD